MRTAAVVVMIAVGFSPTAGVARTPSPGAFFLRPTDSRSLAPPPPLAELLGLPPTGACLRALIVFIGIPPHQRAVSATLSLDGHVLRHFTSILDGRGFKPLGVRVNLQKVTTRSFTLTIVERTRAGRTLRVSQTYHKCRPL